MREEQARIHQTYQTTFSEAAAVQARGMDELGDFVAALVQSIGHAYGGLQEVCCSIRNMLNCC